HLYAKTIVIEKNGTVTAFVACDLISLPHQLVKETRKLLEKQIGIPGSNLIMSATHVHAGPQLNPLFWNAVGGTPKQKSKEYTHNLPSKIIKSIRLAKKELQPARVSVGSTKQNSINFNRRFLMKDGTVETNPGRLNPDIVKPTGPTDPDLSVVYFESMDAEPLATLVNFSLHVAVRTGNQITADFPGRIASVLADVKGKEMVTIFTNGMSGNINHVDVDQHQLFGSREESVRIGTILAGNVLEMYPSLRKVESNSLKVHTQPVNLPIPDIQPDKAEWATEVIRQFGDPEHPSSFSDVVEAWRILDLIELDEGLQARHAVTTTVPLSEDGQALMSEVQAITLGDELALVGYPGDAFVELGLSIKEHSPFPFTVVSEQSGNGVLSYVPNKEAFAEGDYEVRSARIKPGGGEIMVEAVINMLNNLR
ncbi:neutral/alkaline non-lysosomal ceramidase N-terminal domain-containing protein, partial [Fodinibius sp.]|uniref:neutral/alkaline non-lysosomal ceramidase N-terminal domain-containing protein n=1 Tax=Fodinibius sp. TaxID=1872440 RepID=UPI003565F024